MSAPKKPRMNGEDEESASAPSPATLLSDDVLFRVLTFNDSRSVISAALTSKCWLAALVNEGSSPFWRGLVELRHPALFEAASVSSATFSSWRDLFLRSAMLRALADDRLRAWMREGLPRFADRISEDEVLFDTGWIRETIPYQSPTAGTTATAIPDASGVFPQPVYYDWGANWDRVADIVPTRPVQAALQRSLPRDPYHFEDWDEGKIWPFRFLGHRRYGCGEQDTLMKEFLPEEHVREMNGRVADWFRARGEEFQSEVDRRAENWIADGLKCEEVGIINEEECADAAEDIVADVTDELFDLIHYEKSGRELLSDIREASEAALYNKDSPLRATLLCTVGNSYAFMPLNYILAKLLSPKDAKLKVYASEEYSVVVDEKRNIVFDNFWYFCDVPASVALERSRDRPQYRFFDFTLGGLAN